MDPYRALGVEAHASRRELKKAYRRLAFLHHPDRNPGDPEAEERFKEIASAYRILSDPKRRAEHDARNVGTATGKSSRKQPGKSTTRSQTTARPEGQTSGREHWGEAFEALRHDSWAGSIPIRFQDAIIGMVLSVSITLASQASRETRGFLVALCSALGLGLVAAWPFSHAASGAHVKQQPLGSLPTFLTGGLSITCGVLGTMYGAGIVTGKGLALAQSSGIPYAVAGGLGGGLFGASVGRIFASVVGPAAGAVSGGLTGSFAGGVVAGFLWYWGAVLKYSAWPVRDEESVAAFAGVVGAFLGSSLAAIYGGLRTSFDDPRP